MGSLQPKSVLMLLLATLALWLGFAQWRTASALDPQKTITQYGHDIWQTEHGLPQDSVGKADGMKSSKCNGLGQPAGCKTRDGRPWFPTTKGAVMIDPVHLRRNELPPPVVIEAAFADKQPLDLSQKVEVPPGRTELDFHYTGLSFVAPEKVKFKYKLEGFDPDWIDAGIRREAHYTNIPPGEYRSRVIASNNDGVWNEAGAGYSLYLRPHFYQTRTFYV